MSTTHRYGIEFLYHITHVENMPSIVEHGIWSHNAARQRFGPENISDPKVQGIRAGKTCFGHDLHNCVCLFFNTINPMCCLKREEDVAVLRLSPSLLEHDRSFFSDGNAAAGPTEFYNDLKELEKLDWECIHYDYKVKDDSEKEKERKRKCAAEVLVPENISFDMVKEIVVKTEGIRQKLKIAFDKSRTSYNRICERVAVDPTLFDRRSVVKTGNIFATKRQTLVNTVNCVGVMGAGIALEFRFRMPAMFERYVELCRAGHFAIGKLWIYKPPTGARDNRWVLNFPTKYHWKHPSKHEYLEAGLEKFVSAYRGKNIQSIAFPMLGATNGGLDEDESLAIMKRHLVKCCIPVEIYRYDPAAADDLHQEFRDRFLSFDVVALAKKTGVQKRRVQMIRDALEQENGIRSLSRLATINGIGVKTLEKCFRYVEAAEAADVDGASSLPL